MKVRTSLIWGAVLFGATIALRLSALTMLPWRIDGDAAVFSLTGKNLIQSREALFGTGWEGHTHLWFYVVGLLTFIIPDPLFAVRLLSAVGGIAGVIATYAFAQRLGKSSTIGLLAAGFLAILPFHIVFSRNGMELTWSAFFLAAILSLLLKNKLSYWSAAGIMTAASLYIAQSARIIPFIVVLFLILRLIHHDKIPRRRYLIQAVFWAVTTIFFYLPQLYYFLYHPSTFNARLGRVFIFDPSHLPQQIALRGGMMPLIWYQLSHTFGAFFTSFPDATLLWYFHLPYLNPLPLAFCVVGLTVTVVHIRQWRSQFILATLALILLASAATTLPPMSSRYVITTPLIAYLAAIGMHTLWGLVTNKKRIFPLRLISTSVCIIIIAIGVAHEIRWYLHHDQTLIFQYDSTTQKNTAITRYLRENPHIRTIYTPRPERIATMVEAYTDAQVYLLDSRNRKTNLRSDEVLFFDTEESILMSIYTKPTQPARQLKTPPGELVGYTIQASAP